MITKEYVKVAHATIPNAFDVDARGRVRVVLEPTYKLYRHKLSFLMIHRKVYETS